MDNATSNFPAVYGEARGTGAAIMGAKWLTATGSAGSFLNGNAGNPNNSLYAWSNSNIANASTMASVMDGTGGNAGYFNLNNASSAYAGLYGTTIGTGPGVMGETASGTAGVMGLTTGAGNSAGLFQINNAGNSNPVLKILSNGTGNAITANRPIQATQFIGDGSLLTNLPGGGAGWGLSGNAGTVDGTNFIGTTDNVPLNFIVNNEKAGRIDFGLFQTALFGHQSGNALTTGTGNSGFGGLTLYTNTTGIENTALGFAALSLNTTSNFNTGVGSRSLETNTSGANNTATGYFSLNTNTTGSKNSAFGSGADVTVNNLTNATAIGYNAKVGASNSLVLGGTGVDAVNVGIGTVTPTEKLDVVGNVKATQFIGDGSLLSNLPGGIGGSGTINYLPKFSSSGTTLGSSLIFDNGTSVGIGTTSVSPVDKLHVFGGYLRVENSTPMIVLDHTGLGQTSRLYFRDSFGNGNGDINWSQTNGLSFTANGFGEVMRMTSSGSVGIGTPTPSQKLDVVGTVKASTFIGDGSALTGVIPSGIIMPFAGTVTPAGYLLCDGSAVSRTTYANLFAAIGTSWGVGDGSTTFNLPDFRGRFMRGVDGGAAIDPDAGGRIALNGGATGDNVGSYQDDQYLSHTHNVASGGYSTSIPPGDTFVAGLQGWNGGQTTSAAGGSETRPKNAYVNYIIKL